MAMLALLAAAAPANVPDWKQNKYQDSNLISDYFAGFGHCIAKYLPAQGEEFVASRPGSASKDLTQNLADKAMPCILSGRVRMSVTVLRGVVAEALLKTDRKPKAPDWFSASDTREQFEAKLDPNQDLIGRGAAFCEVREGRPLVERLLKTHPGTPPERSALNNLNPILSRCLGNRQMLFAKTGRARAYFAEALYWRRGLEAAK